ncbi:MAG: hypothetical protein EAY75_07700 [Bacteroidetes bacterium]|nr:MAG: hypothetical protein EAY75_07700 [Bacteroidota bacterium]
MSTGQNGRRLDAAVAAMVSVLPSRRVCQTAQLCLKIQHKPAWRFSRGRVQVKCYGGIKLGFCCCKDTVFELLHLAEPAKRAPVYFGLGFCIFWPPKLRLLGRYTFQLRVNKQPLVTSGASASPQHNTVNSLFCLPHLRGRPTQKRLP